MVAEGVARAGGAAEGAALPRRAGYRTQKQRAAAYTPPRPGDEAPSARRPAIHLQPRTWTEVLATRRGDRDIWRWWSGIRAALDTDAGKATQSDAGGGQIREGASTWARGAQMEEMVYDEKAALRAIAPHYRYRPRSTRGSGVVHVEAANAPAGPYGAKEAGRRAGASGDPGHRERHHEHAGSASESCRSTRQRVIQAIARGGRRARRRGPPHV